MSGGGGGCHIYSRPFSCSHLGRKRVFRPKKGRKEEQPEMRRTRPSHLRFDHHQQFDSAEMVIICSSFAQRKHWCKQCPMFWWIHGRGCDDARPCHPGSGKEERNKLYASLLPLSQPTNFLRKKRLMLLHQHNLSPSQKKPFMANFHLWAITSKYVYEEIPPFPTKIPRNDMAS